MEKIVTYRLEFSGNHVTNWTADAAAKKGASPQRVPQSGGIAKVQPEVMRQGLRNLDPSEVADSPEVPTEEVRQAMRRVRAELDQVPDDAKRISYITNR